MNTSAGVLYPRHLRGVVQMASELNQPRLRHFGQICVAWHEAANALVAVFDRTFLPRRAGIAETTACADAIFQSPEAGKLGAAVKGEALACKGEKASMILSMIGRECRLGFLIVTV